MALALETNSILDQKIQSKEDTIAFINQIVEQGNARLWPLRKIACESLLYYVGEQNLVFNPNLRRWVGRAPGMDYLTSPSINLILPQVEVAVAQLIKSEPEGIVVPGSTDEEDRMGARAADKIRKAKDWEDGIEKMVRRLALMKVICGDAFAFTFIGADHSKEIQVPKMITEPAAMNENGEPIFLGDIPTYSGVPPAMGPDGQPIFQMITRQVTDPVTGAPVMQSIPMTDVKTDIWSKFETILDFDAGSFDEVRWALSSKVKSYDWIEDTFGSDAANAVKKDSAEVGVSAFNWRFMDFISRGMEGGAGLANVERYALQHSGVINTFIEKPSKRIKKGRVKITCRNQILYEDSNPWHLTEDPQQLGLTQFGYSPILDTPWHFGLPKNIIDLNRRIRGIHASIMHHRRTMGFGQWIIPKGSAVLGDKQTGKPGLVLYYDPRKTGGTPPQRVSGVSMDAAVMEELEHCMKLLKEIAGTEEVLQGQQPYAGMPGISLNLLAEKAGSRFVMAKQNFEAALAQMASQRLRLIPLTRRWQRPQIVKVLGRDGEVEVDSFAAADMRGNFDVRYEVGNKRAGSQAAHQQNIIDLSGNGVIDVMDPANRQMIREEFGMTMFNDPESLDRMMARWENLQMEKGKPMEMQPFEDSHIHWKEHIKFTKTVAFLRLDPKIKDIFYAHIVRTQERMDAIDAMAAENDVIGPEPNEPDAGMPVAGAQPPSNGANGSQVNGSAGTLAPGGSETPAPPTA